MYLITLLPAGRVLKGNKCIRYPIHSLNMETLSGQREVIKRDVGSSFLKDIFKIHVYNAEGNVHRVYIFAGGQIDDSYLPQLFSSDTLSAYERNHVEYIFSEHQLYHDDTMENVKRKLLANIGNVSYEELYLFCWKRLPKYVDESVPLSVFLRNVNIQSELLEQCDTYTTFFKQTTDQDMYQSHSMGYNKVHGPHRVINPFLVTSIPVTTALSDATEQDTCLLLEYGDIIDNSLFLCCSQDVLQSLDDTSFTTQILHAYFPYVMEQENKGKKDLSPWSLTSADRFHHLYYQRNEDLPYVSKGILKFTMIMTTNNHQKHRRWPLEVIFKQLHATQGIPMLILNPG